MTNTNFPRGAGVRRTTLLRHLDLDWDRLSRRPDALARARAWGLDVEITSLDDVVRACGFHATAGDRVAAVAEPIGGSASGVPVLARLVRLARHDDLAARVVLQRLLPGLVAEARFWMNHVTDVEPDRAVDEIVTAAWGVIRTFPVERSDHQLAARLLRDAAYHAFRRDHRRRAEVVPMAPVHFEDAPTGAGSREAMEELTELVATARRSGKHGFGDRDLELLRLLLSGRPMVDIAACLKVSERTVRNHRDAMVHRLRQVAFAAA